MTQEEKDLIEKNNHRVLQQIKIVSEEMVRLHEENKPPVSDGLYQSLEEILQDMIDQKRPLTIMSKLQNTINKGYYINTRPTE